MRKVGKITVRKLRQDRKGECKEINWIGIKSRENRRKEKKPSSREKM